MLRAHPVPVTATVRTTARRPVPFSRPLASSLLSPASLPHLGPASLTRRSVGLSAASVSSAVSSRSATSVLLLRSTLLRRALKHRLAQQARHVTAVTEYDLHVTRSRVSGRPHYSALARLFS
eukprot:1184255-Prorocentrum_minimum.AAC.3